MDFQAEILDYLLTALVGVATIAAGWAVAWLRGKSKRELFHRGLDLARTVAGLAFREVNQTYVDDIKKGREDGLTKVEQRRAMSRAVECARGLAGLKGVKLVLKVFGATQLEFPTIISPMIEAGLADHKAEIRALRDGVAASIPTRPSGGH